jgi:pyruvate,orthophosphate dikinase
MNGRVAFTAEDLRWLAAEYPGENRVLVRPDTVPDDIGMIFESEGLLTARGGVTSHAAVTATRLGKTCVVNCRALEVHEAERFCRIRETRFNVGDQIAIDGYLGNILKGCYPVTLSDARRLG